MALLGISENHPILTAAFKPIPMSMISEAMEMMGSNSVTDTLQKVDLSSTDSAAVCNDGSPAMYYWKKSTQESND